MADFQVPYHRAWIGDEEVAAVSEVLRSGWLTSGPKVREFESALSRIRDDHAAVAVSSCSAGLFLALRALDLPEGSEVISTPFTFIASLTAILHNRLKPVLVDIDPLTLNIDPEKVEAAITPRTKAILPVHIAGNPCRMDYLCGLAEKHNLHIVEDCAHALEGRWEGKALGSFGIAGSFSFYATKNITTAEGGMVLTSSEEMAERLRRMRLHGIDRDAFLRDAGNGYLYDVTLPGYKFNLSDLQAALGLAQLNRLEVMYGRREAIRNIYDMSFSHVVGLDTIRTYPGAKHALHLYQLRMDPARFKADREEILAKVQERGVQVSVNYRPIHEFTWYKREFEDQEANFPEASAAGATTFSLPFYPALSTEQIHKVIAVVTETFRSFYK